MSTIKAPPIYKIIASQLIAVGFITTVGYTTLDWISAYSLLLGGMICTVPNAYFSFKAFRYRGARAAQKIVRAFYLGEAVKILLMGAGFALSFIYVEPLSSRALFAGFITVYLVGLMATMRVTRKTNY
ncbi:MAG: ATP synthase subunit I [Gammaproteobacteria bacterium]